jgi:8-oxo-dGTP pyrophosphatase MutT (NUDIX family)
VEGMPFEKSVGAVVFRREKGKIKYLLLQHPRSGIYRGHWDFPKGHIEKGESWEDTLRREVKEETGITKLQIIPGFSAWIKYFYRAKGKEKEERRRKKQGSNVLKIVTYYPVETKVKKVRLSFEHQNYAWLEYKEALERITFKNSRKVLQKAHWFLMKKKKEERKC